MISTLIFLFPLFLIPFFIYKWFNTCSITSKNQPPSPRKLPVVGNLHQLSLYPHRSLQLLARKYGELMLLHLGSVPVLIVSSADAAREIMKTHDLVFASRPMSSIVDRLFYNSKDIAFAPYGEYWRQVRSISVLHLLSTKRVRSYRSVRKEEASLLIDTISEKLCISSNSNSALVDLTHMFGLFTNDIAARVALGKKYSDGVNGRNFESMLNEFTELIGTFNIGDYIPWLAFVNRVNGKDARVKKVAQEFDEFFEGVIEEHIQKAKGGGNLEVENGSDFVDILLEIQRENSLGFPIQRDTIKAMIMDTFGGGTKTTQTVLEWVMSELIRHPKIMNKLQTEIRTIGQGKTDIFHEDDIVKMHYLQAVIKETLRLHPPGSIIPREATQNVKLMGYEIKQGTQVLINAWAIGRDPSTWKMPGEFQPERFINSNIDVKGLDFEMIPFGSGRRGCPGATFALDSIELALAELIYKFNFSLPEGQRGEDLDMTEAHGGSIHRKYSLVVVITPRND